MHVKGLKMSLFSQGQIIIFIDKNVFKNVW